jgi:hypothetical protein
MAAVRPPCGRSSTDTAVWPSQGGLPTGCRRVGHGGPSSNFRESVDTPSHTAIKFGTVSLNGSNMGFKLDCVSGPHQAHPTGGFHLYSAGIATDL